jgi:hypothetical protein
MIPGVLNANHMPRISLLRLGFANAFAFSTPGIIGLVKSGDQDPWRVSHSSNLRYAFRHAYPAPLVDMHVPDVVHY